MQTVEHCTIPNRCQPVRDQANGQDNHLKLEVPAQGPGEERKGMHALLNALPQRRNEMNCGISIEKKLKELKYARLYGAEKAKSSLAATLIESRKKANLTQEELARKLGISQPYVARLEGGKANPTLGTIGSLLAVIGCRLTTNVACLAPEQESPSAGSSDSTATKKT